MHGHQLHNRRDLVQLGVKPWYFIRQTGRIRTIASAIQSIEILQEAIHPPLIRIVDKRCWSTQNLPGSLNQIAQSQRATSLQHSGNYATEATETLSTIGAQLLNQLVIAD